MAQFEFKCPHCRESIEADDSFRGQVVECPSCGKGIVVPSAAAGVPRTLHNRPRGIPVTAPTMPSPDDTRHMSHYEQMMAQGAEERRREKMHGLLKIIVGVIFACIVGVFGFMMWNKVKSTERQQSLAQQEAERQEAERIAQQKREREELIAQQKREEEENQEKAVKLFHAYLDREESRLKNIIEEAKINCERCDIDQKELAEELERIEKENARLANASRQRKQKRYEKAEHVLLLLKSPVLNVIYEKYLGEDIAAIRAKYENEVKTVIKLHRDTEARLRKNRDKYFATVQGINEEVEQKNEAAVRRASSAKAKTQAQLNKLREKRQQLEKRLSDEQNKRVITSNVSISGKVRETNGAKNRRQRIAALTAEIESLDRDIATAEALASGNQAQMAHLEATTAETAARRKFDTAIEVRQSEDNDVHADARHESDVFQIAARYEKDTLDALRQAILGNRQFQELKAGEAQRKLDFITRSAANIDFMTADEIEGVRKKIVARLAEGVIGDGEKEKNP